MIKEKTVFDFLSQVMVVWGVSVLSLCFFCVLFGETGQEYSSIFGLGSAGIPVSTLIQFLGLAVLIVGFKYVFFTDCLIKNLGIWLRSSLMFAGIILTIVIFVALFQWFPINQIKPWIMFVVCFSICSAVSVLVSVIKEKSDNRKMQEALERMKGEK